MHSNSLFAVLALAAAASAQIPVSGGGDALRMAVTEASDGSVLEVATGVYGPFVVPGGIQLTIVAPNRATIRHAPGADFPDYDIGVRPGATLRVQGLDCKRNLTAGGGLAGGGLAVVFGDLVVEDCTFADTIDLNNTTAVIARTDIDSAGPGIVITASDVVVSDTVILASTDSGVVFGLAGGVLRAERVIFEGAAVGLFMPSFFPGGPSFASVADSVLRSSPRGISAGVGAFGTLQLQDTSIPNGVNGAYSTVPLATATLEQDALEIGAIANFTFSGAPNTPMCILVTWGSVQRFDLGGFAAQPLFVLGTPDFIEITGGVTDTDGDFALALPLPAGIGLEFQPLWLVGITGSSLPVQNTVPAGGIVR